jgi:hypothetical protein
MIPCLLAAPAEAVRGHGRGHHRARSHGQAHGHANPQRHGNIPHRRDKPSRPAVHPPRATEAFDPPRPTGSLYIRSVHPAVMHTLGCRAGGRRASGIVILDFGRLYYDGHSYGAQTFSGRFASNRAITRAMKSFARGYARCLPTWSHARIVLGRGTSNYSPAVPSTYEAGRRWARETVGFAMFLRRAGLIHRVRAAAADDAEPAWNPSFLHTRDFFRGYRDYRPGYTLYNYGSLDGGVGKYWNIRQAWFVSGGMRYAQPIPEIYYRPMARQWGELARQVARRYGRVLKFAGLMTQHSTPCRRCGYRPHEAHRALMRALPRWLQRHLQALPALTNIHAP